MAGHNQQMHLWFWKNDNGVSVDGLSCIKQAKKPHTDITNIKHHRDADKLRQTVGFFSNMQVDF